MTTVAFGSRTGTLDTGARSQIYQCITSEPGLSIRELADRVGLSSPTVRYHLDRLEKAGLVVCLQRGHRMLFFRHRRDFSEPERVLVSLLRDAESMRVYDHVSASPWITRRELSDALKVSRTAVNWHLRILTEAGLVGEAREQGMGFLFATREGKESLASVAGRVAASATEQASALTQSLAAAPRATA